MDRLKLMKKMNLERIMHEKKVSQTALANLLGTSPVTINRVLTGDRGLGNKLLIQIATALHIDPAEFLKPQIDDTAEKRLINESLDQALAELGMTPDDFLLIKKIKAHNDPRLLPRLLLHVTEKTKSLWVLLGLLDASEFHVPQEPDRPKGSPQKAENALKPQKKPESRR